MFDLNINFQDISLSSINKDDLVEVYNLIIKDKSYSKKNSQLDFNEFCNRFLEYYLGEGEVFLKICKSSKLVGILKGRLEFKSNNEMWIWYFNIVDNIRENGVASEIIKEIKKYFIYKLGINKFYVVISSEEKEYLNFWKRNGFILERISDNFVDNEVSNRIFIFVNNEKGKKNET